jgi:hypothetical protein
MPWIAEPHLRSPAEEVTVAEQEAYISLSPDIQELLSDNGTSIEELLALEHVDVRVELRTDPAASAGDQDKELVILLLGTAAIIAAVTPLLSRVIARISNRRLVITEKVLLPVQDADGNVIRDRTGEPLLYWADRHKLMEKSRGDHERTSAKVSGPISLELQLESSQ